MSQKSFPWTANATGDGTTGGYTALEWSELWRYLYLGGNEASGGVLFGVGGVLYVTTAAGGVSVASGAAVVYGKLYQNTSAANLTVTTPVVGTTGGVVVVRLDWAAQTVRLLANRNTDGLAAIPSLTQNTSTVWEIPLAIFTIATSGVITLTDARKYCTFGAVVHPNAVDGVSIEINAVQRIGVADGGIGTSKLANNAVTSTKIANSAVGVNQIANGAVDENKITGGIPSLIRRQGGSASDWRTYGTTNYIPSGVRMQSGATTVVHSAGSSMTRNVTFPVAYTQPPIVMATVASLNGGEPVSAIVTSVTTTGFSIYAYSIINGYTLTQDQSFNWLAIGTI